jgi:mono/diheme cytochrome c family protein
MPAIIPRVVAGVLAAACVLAAVPVPAQPTRGELLYSTHCIACHTEQVHWRERRLAKDWASLKQQVRRWADNASLGWSEEDIVEVARYLNAAHYRFEMPALTQRLRRSPGLADAPAG